MKQVAKALLLAAMVAGPMIPFSAIAAEPGLVISSTPLRIDRVTVLSVAGRDKNVVAVGERGAIFLSNDGGGNWRGLRAPTTRTLTGVVSVGDAWLVAGHGGVLMRMNLDGSQAQLIKTEAGRDSFLGLIALDDQNILAYGSFGMMFRSSDGGRSWSRQAVIGQDFDRHITFVARMGDRLILLGESGTMAKSMDGGHTWSKLVSPYEGSWFGGAVTPTGALLIFGMRGNIYRTSDGGTSWEKIDVPTKASFYGASILDDGRIVVTGSGGSIAVSKDDGRSLELKRMGAADIAGIYTSGKQQAVIFGRQGVRPFSLGKD